MTPVPERQRPLPPIFTAGVALSTGLSLAAAILLSAIPSVPQRCVDLAPCALFAISPLTWEVVIVVGSLPILLLLRPRLALVSLAGSAFFLALSTGMYFSFLFGIYAPAVQGAPGPSLADIALPLLCLGALGGVLCGLMAGARSTPLPMRSLVLLFAVSWMAAAPVLLLDSAYAWPLSGPSWGCTSFGGCWSFGPYLWPYAQITAALLGASVGVGAMTQLRSSFWTCGLIGAAMALAGLGWFVSINPPLDLLPVGIIVAYGSLALVAVSIGFYDAGHVQRRLKPARQLDVPHTVP